MDTNWQSHHLLQLPQNHLGYHQDYYSGSGSFLPIYGGFSPIYGGFSPMAGWVLPISGYLAFPGAGFAYYGQSAFDPNLYAGMSNNVGYYQPTGEMVDDVYVITRMPDHINEPFDDELFDDEPFDDYISMFDLGDDMEGYIEDMAVVEANIEDRAEVENIIAKCLKTRIYYSTPAKVEVNPIETVTYADDGGDICVICQGEYEDKERIGTLVCGHEYHARCIEQWLLRKKDCPICRASILPTQEHTGYRGFRDNTSSTKTFCFNLRHDIQGYGRPL